MENYYCITVNLQGIEFCATQTGLANMAAAAVAASKATEFNILPRPFEIEKLMTAINEASREIML